MTANILVHDAVCGPVNSRRFGRSLLVNPLPANSRLCNFDCVYCECARGSWPVDFHLQPDLPDPKSIYDALVAAAATFRADELDSITISGSGEPTLSPHLEGIVEAVNTVRDHEWPQARTIVLTNGSLCHKPRVRAAIANVDERIVKLDAGTNWMFDQLNRPAKKLSVGELCRRISMTGEFVIQSMFVQGPLDNTLRSEVEAWTNRIAELKPMSVQIYSLDQAPSKTWVRRVPREKLDAIAEHVQYTTGIPVHVF